MAGNNLNNSAPKPKAVPGVSCSLEGGILDDFNVVKAHLVNVAPGLRPTNADVARYAIHLAASTVTPKPDAICEKSIKPE